MQTPREACEMHYVKWGKKNDEKKNSNDTLKCFCHAVKSVLLIFFFLFDFFFLLPNFFLFFFSSPTFCLLWSRGYGVASYGSPTVVLHCSLVFLGVGGKDRNCIDSLPHPILLLLLPPPSLHQPARAAAAAAGSAVVILTCSLRHEHQSATPPLLPSRPSSGPDPPSSRLPLSLTPVF